MPADTPTIVASSIGFNSLGRGPFDWSAGPIYRYAADLAGAGEHPRICYVGTAGGDNPAFLQAIYAAFCGAGFLTSHLSLFTMPNVDDVRGHLLDQDVIWVGGGSTVNLLAVWRAHGLDAIMRECWEAGVVLGGVSAGSLCWHQGGTTDSFGPELRPVTNCLGFLPYSNGVHYDGEPQRRPLYHRYVADGTFGPGYATDNGVAVIYRGTEMVEAVAESAGVAAYHLERGPDGNAIETPLPTRVLRS